MIKGPRIIRNCAENSSLGKCLASNEVQRTLGLVSDGEGYDYSRIEVWIKEVVEKVHPLFSAWVAQSLTLSGHEVEWHGAVADVLRQTVQVERVLKVIEGKVLEHGHPLEKVHNWVDELARQLVNSYKIYSWKD